MDYGYPGMDLLSGMYQSSTAVIIFAIIAVIGGIALYFTFLSPKNENKFTGFTGWLYGFLHFKKLLLESLLKILYVVTAIFITLFSFYLLFAASFWTFLGMLVIGNVVWRIAYEFMLLIIVISRNTSDINRKLKQ
jgi:hypothetical protein